MAKITIYVPDQAPAKYGLGEEEAISIGRTDDNDIVLDHASVSGNHAVIRRIGAGLHVLEDQNSTNGIYLEGEKVTEAPLGNGASFTIGSVPGEYEGDVSEQGSAPEQQADTEYQASSGGGYGSPTATIAESSTRPSGFTDLSPIEIVEKSDSLSKIALLAGTVAISAAILLVFLSLIMNVN